MDTVDAEEEVVEEGEVDRTVLEVEDHFHHQTVITSMDTVVATAQMEVEVLIEEEDLVDELHSEINVEDLDAVLDGTGDRLNGMRTIPIQMIRLRQLQITNPSHRERNNLQRSSQPFLAVNISHQSNRRMHSDTSKMR